MTVAQKTFSSCNVTEFHYSDADFFFFFKASENQNQSLVVLSFALCLLI
jgi:hypothetical protein